MDKDKALRLALKLAFRMGQDYWYHADHEFSSYHKKADAIRAEFDQLVEKTIKQALANDALDKMAENERELGIQMQPDVDQRSTESKETFDQPEPVAWDICRGEKQCRIWCGNSACVSHWNYTSPPKREWQGLHPSEYCGQSSEWCEGALWAAKILKEQNT